MLHVIVRRRPDRILVAVQVVVRTERTVPHPAPISDNIRTGIAGTAYVVVEIAVVVETMLGSGAIVVAAIVEIPAIDRCHMGGTGTTPGDTVGNDTILHNGIPKIPTVNASTAVIVVEAIGVAICTSSTKRKALQKRVGIHIDATQSVGAASESIGIFGSRASLDKGFVRSASGNERHAVRNDYTGAQKRIRPVAVFMLNHIADIICSLFSIHGIAGKRKFHHFGKGLLRIAPTATGIVVALRGIHIPARRILCFEPDVLAFKCRIVFKSVHRLSAYKHTIEIESLEIAGCRRISRKGN